MGAQWLDRCEAPRTHSGFLRSTAAGPHQYTAHVPLPNQRYTSSSTVLNVGLEKCACIVPLALQAFRGMHVLWMLFVLDWVLLDATCAVGRYLRYWTLPAPTFRPHFFPYHGAQ